jgi:thiol-disulfide isomerase/thioredoxin
MRLFAAGLLALSLSAIACADDKKDDKKEQTAKAVTLKDVQAELQKAMPKAREDFGKAKNQEEKDAVIDQLITIVEKAYTAAEADPKAKESVEALGFVLQVTSGMPKTKKGTELKAKTTKSLLTNQIDSPELAKLLPALGRDSSDETIKTLTEVAEKSKAKAVKGAALFTIGKAYAEQSEEAKDVAKAAELSKKSEEYFEKVVKDFADVDGDEGKYGKQAEKELFLIRNLGIGKPAPAAEGKDIDGKPVKLSDYKGKVVVIDIWATWCGPCRAMIPHERELVKKMADKPFVLVSISADDKVETLKEFIAKEPMPWTHWFNGAQGGIVEAWNVQFFPTIYVLDAKGVIRYKGVRGKQMDEAVETLVKEIESKK